MSDRPLRILSLGAGVQSTTVLLMSARGVLPKLDAAVFADTRWEPAAVYRHLDWLEAEAGRHGIPVHRVSAGNLREDALEFRQNRVSSDGKRYASMPVFIKNPDGSQGITRRQCTSEYKIQPVERFIRRELLGLKPKQRAPKNAVEHWFGISAEEFSWRGRTSKNHWQTFRYPLVFDLNSHRPENRELFLNGYDRQDCLNWMEANGYPKPPRSACIGCPFHSDAEWKSLTPDEFADAAQFDDDMRKLERPTNRGVPFLHRSLVPLRLVKFADKRGRWAEECGGVCGV